MFTRGIVFFYLVGVTPGLFAQQMENFEVLWQVQAFHGDTSAFGFALAGGDLNGDGYVDLVIADKTDANNYPFTGAIYVFWGNNQNTYTDTFTINNPSSLPPNLTDFPTSIAIGDFNGDGYDDLLAGDQYWAEAPYLGYAGRAYVYYGGPTFDTIPDLVIGPIYSDYALGRSVSNLGDLNGDGFEDFGIGAPMWPGYPIIGRVHIFFGGPNLDETPDLTLVGFPDEQNFGLEIGGGEDVNGDGYDDVLVASWGPGWPPQGRIFVFFGGDPMDSLWDFTVASRWGRFMGVDGGVVALKNFTHWGYADVAAAAHGVVDTGVVFRGEERIKPNPVAKLLEEQQTAIEEFGYDLAASRCLNFSALSASNRYFNNRAGAVYFYVGGPSFDTLYDALFTGSNQVARYRGNKISRVGSIDADQIDELLVANLVSYDPYYLPAYVWLIRYTGTGVQEPPDMPTMPLRISVYPTVAKDFVNIVFTGIKQGPVGIIVYDATGRRIYTARKEVMSHEGQLTWHLVDKWGHRVPDGIYFLQVLSNRGRVAMERVMVLKKQGGKP